MRIRITTDIPLSPEARDALADFAYGSAWFDLDGGFRAGADPERRQAVELVVKDRLPDGITAEPTGIRHIGPDTLPEGTFLLLRDNRGGLHDCRSCTQHIGTRHVFGALFRDESGTVWAARKTDGEVGSGEIAADWPLEQVSAHTHPTVEAGFGRILDSLPAMGEFQLTNEVPARVAWIPWWSGFGSNPKEGISNPSEDAVLRELVGQAREFHATGTVHPDPAPVTVPRIMSLDGTAQEHELLVTLHDWRPDEEVGPDEPGKTDLRITLRADQLLIDTPDGRQIMIELEGDQLKAHAYTDVSDAPATLRVRCGAPIEADISDHLSEIYEPEEGPTP
jgi:hypothetical protein